MSVTVPRGGGSLGSKPLEFWGGNVRAENSLFQRLGFLASSVIGFRRLCCTETLCKVSALWFLGVALRLDLGDVHFSRPLPLRLSFLEEGCCVAACDGMGLLSGRYLKECTFGAGCGVGKKR